MRSPRLIFAVVAGVLVLTGFLLPRYLADRSRPDLGETVVVPASTSTPTPTPPASPTTGPPTPTRATTGPGADPVSPGEARSAGQDDEDDPTDDPDDDG
ncbi:hypothetical protein [Kribbella shirazensis]|uniref:Uncharacterized protein n=1 Tax=Kribbella shirazensis TaxID=1105143 RepID=A0A7X5VD73_9ACTN|nr:hypothetical protein [Kribbella shirazensis]NIK58621.1 hypothetical protein [Kribbella shirazensis]